MDIILALKFASGQYINGVIDGEDYHQRILELLEEAVSDKNADAQMHALAMFLVK